MMKSTKPISSPGRTTEKFPPPLMRFLRSNVGSKSTKRGGRRSRASPMFFRKKNTNIDAIQEPSSPKVTCIGQVRVRRSKKNNKTTTTTTNVATTASSSAVHRRKSRNIFCRCFRKLKPRSIFNVLSKWVSFFRCGYCESSTFLDDSPVDVCTPVSVIKKVAGKNGEEQEKEEEDINQGLISKSPPKNAFLLTRCRSAPYRSSSLANKFWESGMEKKEEVEEEIAEKIKNLKIKKEDENENENGDSKCNERNEVEELKADKEEVKEVPLILNRCKSEPATTWKQILIVHMVTPPGKGQPDQGISGDVAANTLTLTGGPLISLPDLPLQTWGPAVLAATSPLILFLVVLHFFAWWCYTPHISITSHRRVDGNIKYH